MKKHTSKPTIAALWKNHRELCEKLKKVRPENDPWKTAEPEKMETDLVKVLASENKQLREKLKKAAWAGMDSAAQAPEIAHKKFVV